MKSVILSIVLLLALTNCSDPDVGKLNAELIIGTWKNTNNEFTLEFDHNNNCVITMIGGGENGVAHFKYHLDSHLNKFYLDDSEIEFEFLGSDRLKLIEKFPPSFSEEESVVFYDRIK